MDGKAPGEREPVLAEPGKLAQTQKLAEIGLMTSAVLHELRQPLSGIKGYAQLLEEQGLKEMAGFILAQVERMEQLVAAHRRFLAPAGEDRARVELGALAAEAARLAEPLARQSGVAIELRCAAPVHVQASEGRLLQILVNLLDNAVDASASGDRRPVEVIVRQDAGVAEILVADRGPGVPPAQQSLLFTPFFSTKGPEKGTGLGLYISRALARSVGATLVHLPPSAPGAPTLFRLRFGGADEPSAAPRLRRPSVLLVDDEEVILQLLSTLLAPEGVDLVTASSGEEALEQVARQRFDLVIADKNLPGATGLEVARAARQKHPGCAVMLMTGYPSLETALEGLALGVVDYLEKPFDDIAEIRRRVREALRPQGSRAPTPAGRRVLVVEDRPDEAVRLAEGVTLAGGIAVRCSTLAEAAAHLGTAPASAVVLSLDLKDKALSPEAIRALRQGAGGLLLAVSDRPTLEQTIVAIRLGAAACLPRALATPEKLSRELADRLDRRR